MNHRRIPFGLLGKAGASVTAAVSAFLEQAGLEYEKINGGFLLSADEDEPSLDCIISCSTDSLLQVLASYRHPFPKQCWISVIRCLNQLNVQLGAGRFILDPGSGRVGFKVSLLASGQDFSQESVKRQFDLCLRHAALAQRFLERLGHRQLTAAEASDSILKALGASARHPTSPHSWN